MKSYVIKVNEELVNKIQNSQYESEAIKDVISNIISIGDPALMENPSFKKYNEKMIEAKKNYEKSKGELETLIIPEVLKSHLYSWNLDFSSRLVKVDIGCDCGEEILNTLNIPAEV